jgi:putative CocE/NonD family hydrolase
MFDLYEFVYPGGVFKEDFVRSWGGMTLLLDKVTPAAPVDGDQDGTLLKEAVREHRDNQNIYALAVAEPYRDSVDPPTGTLLFSELSPSSYLDAINRSGVAIYTLGGWYDMYPRDALIWFNNLTVPQKVIITPWSHNGSGGFDLTAEHLRWFDYWLKGIDNGIMDEPPLYYAVMGAPRDQRWRFADQWPLPEEQPTPYYLRTGPSGSAASVNDGLLSLAVPTDQAGQDDYVVDYTTTTGPTTRWTDGYGGGYGYPDMAANDAKGLTYTTPPLEQAVEVTGHPVVHLWVTSSADDGNFFAYLEEVDQNGVSTYITEGVLKASHRALSAPPWNIMGLPFHAGHEQGLAPLPPGEPIEQVFDLQPTSNVFDAGHRIRVTITGADADNFNVPALDPAPTVSLYRSADHASYIVLPVIP